MYSLAEQDGANIKVRPHWNARPGNVGSGRKTIFPIYLSMIRQSMLTCFEARYLHVYRIKSKGLDGVDFARIPAIAGIMTCTKLV